jgi:hypothetical protein
MRPELSGTRLHIPMQDASVEIRDVTGALRWSARPAVGDLDLRASGVSGLAFVVLRMSGLRWNFTSNL